MTQTKYGGPFPMSGIDDDKLACVREMMDGRRELFTAYGGPFPSQDDIFRRPVVRPDPPQDDGGSLLELMEGHQANAYNALLEKFRKKTMEAIDSVGDPVSVIERVRLLHELLFENSED